MISLRQCLFFFWTNWATWNSIIIAAGHLRIPWETKCSSSLTVLRILDHCQGCNFSRSNWRLLSSAYGYCYAWAPAFQVPCHVPYVDLHVVIYCQILPFYNWATAFCAIFSQIEDYFCLQTNPRTEYLQFVVKYLDKIWSYLPGPLPSCYATLNWSHVLLTYLETSKQLSDAACLIVWLGHPSNSYCLDCSALLDLHWLIC